MSTAIKKQNEISNRPALRLVKTNDLSHVDWLEVRKNGIGSSDAAAAVGLNPYKSQLELWMEKTGRDENLQKPDANEDASPMYWGTLLEVFVAAHYTKKTGNRVRKVNAVLQHHEHSYMLANLDREVIGAPDVQVLECKTTGMNGQRLWRDGVPEYIVLQVQHQLCVTGKQAADVAVLVCGNDFRVYRIKRDDNMIARLIELEQRFWHYVITDTPPPADGSDSSAAALQALYQNDTGTSIDLAQDVEMANVFHDLLMIRKTIADAVNIESLFKQKIQQRMGNVSIALFGDSGTVSWKRSKDSTVLDVEKLLTVQPELLERYPLVKEGSRRFLISA